MTSLILVSFDACPFVQRAAIVLEEQKRPYDIKYIDLRNKPDWFLEVSPMGKVPVLQVDGVSLFESAVILDYLDETATDGKLLPEEPVARAQQRMWISYIGNVMAKGWQLQAANEEQAARALCAEIRGHFEELLKNRPGDGPMWGGESFTMVDAAIAPILQRFTWAETLEPSIGIFADMPAMVAWRDAVLARPSAPSSIVPDLEQRSGRMLKTIGGWVARSFEG